MKVSKRELTTAALTFLILSKDDKVLKAEEKWSKKELDKRPEVVVLAQFYITPELGVSWIYDKREPDSWSFVLYDVENEKEFEYELNWKPDETATDTTYQILYELLEKNGVKVRKLF